MAVLHQRHGWVLRLKYADGRIGHTQMVCECREIAREAAHWYRDTQGVVTATPVKVRVTVEEVE